MATIYYTTFLAILLLFQSHIVTSTFNPEDICRTTNVCGRGKCVRNRDSIFGFECDCDDGWIQARPENDRYFRFLPCIIPDCLINQDCFDAFPVPRINDRPDLTNYDPCSFIDCGGGKCRTTSPFTYVCECRDDYFNILNLPTFPCFKPCAFGDGCPSIGRDFANTTTSVLDRSPGFSNNSTSQASSFIRGTEIATLITIIATIAMVY